MDVLHLSEPETALRIRVARVSREHPMVLTMLREGRIHLSGVALLAPLLTRDNRDALLERAVHKSKRQILELIAELTPQPSQPAAMRRLPTRREGESEQRPDAFAAADQGSTAPESPEQRPDAAVPATLDHPGSPSSGQRPDAVAAPRARTAVVEPIAPERFRVRFDASAELHDKLVRLQALMRSSVPDGDLAVIIDLAVTEKLERLEARRFGKTKAPRKSLAETDTRPKSRYIPAPVRRTVEKRDGGRCTYEDRHGRRCTKRHDLEFHHRRPFGRGGEHSPEVLCLMCKPHNALMAEQDYGKEVMARYRRGARRGPESAASH
jgi:5-methylcytosine-specific restriction endonuclease McrA